LIGIFVTSPIKEEITDMKEPSGYVCLNCDSNFEDDFQYCPNCGQKNTDGKITFTELWAEFQDAIFNIESRTWRTLKAIFVPGKLTLEYFAGKHRRYVHPVRLLIITSVLTIVALSFQDVQSYTNHKFVIKDKIKENYERQRVYRIMAKIIDSTHNIYPDAHAKAVTDTAMSVFEDSINNLLYRYGDTYGDSVDLNYYIPIGSSGIGENISKRDFLTMTEDELVKKYKKDAGLFQKLVFRQKAKYVNDETQLASAVVGRFTLGILSMMPFVALVLYFLYRRRQFYYIENLIFSFHFHAFSFIILTSYVLIWDVFPEWMFYIPIFIIEVYLFISMKRVYRQGIPKTVLKFVLLNISYIVLLWLFVLGTFLVSFFLL